MKRNIVSRLFFMASVLSLYSVTAFPMASKVDWDAAVDSAIVRYGLRLEPQLVRAFSRAHVSYPPKDVALLAFKKERRMELWARSEDNRWHYIQYYPLTAFSGQLGPKLKERDGQIPEGIYHITMLNPFSQYHLSMALDYPNYFDKAHAVQDGRRRLGNDIYIHGKSLSVGCLAIGDKAIDQLFLLARRVGLYHVTVIIAPNDLRHAKPATLSFMQPKWLPDLYKRITQALRPFIRA